MYIQVVLKNFSLSIPGGSVVALVGSSGGGKSDLLEGFERGYKSTWEFNWFKMMI